MPLSCATEKIAVIKVLPRIWSNERVKISQLHLERPKQKTILNSILAHLVYSSHMTNTVKLFRAINRTHLSLFSEIQSRLLHTTEAIGIPTYNPTLCSSEICNTTISFLPDNDFIDYFANFLITYSCLSCSILFRLFFLLIDYLYGFFIK